MNAPPKNSAQRRQRMVTLQFDLKRFPISHRLKLMFGGTLHVLIRRKNAFGEFEITGVNITKRVG